MGGKPGPPPLATRQNKHAFPGIERDGILVQIIAAGIFQNHIGARVECEGEGKIQCAVGTHFDASKGANKCTLPMLGAIASKLPFVA